MQEEYTESIELLICQLNHSVTEDCLQELASLLLPTIDNGVTKIELIDQIVATKKWAQILDGIGINDFRVCSVCGALMHQGYCCDMGQKYYCSDGCLHHDFTAEEWNIECKNESQSYWTDWFEHYELTNKNQKYGTNI